MQTVVNAYIRVSTEEQQKSGLGLEAQQAAIKAYCTMKGLGEPELFIDEAETGANPLGTRPAGKRLLEQLQAAPSMVVCVRLDRLFRSSADATAMIERWTKDGTELVSISEGFDMSTAVGRFIARTMANFAELERELVGERTAAALAVKKSRGERVSRSCPYGQQWKQSGRFNAEGEPILVAEICGQEQDAIRLMRYLRRRKWSLRQIARELDRRGIKPRNAAAWGPSSIALILETNKGHRLPAAGIQGEQEESTLAASPVVGEDESPCAATDGTLPPPAAP